MDLQTFLKRKQQAPPAWLSPLKDHVLPEGWVAVTDEGNRCCDAGCGSCRPCD